MGQAAQGSEGPPRQSYERLDIGLKGFHYIAFACMIITRLCKALA